MPNDDLRADLSAAFDAAEAAPPPDPAPAPVEVNEAPPGASEPVEAPPAATETPQEARRRDELGRFAKAQEDAAKATGEPPAKPQAPSQAKPEGTPPAQPTPPTDTLTAIKPPQSWKPVLREKFASLPPEVQQEVVRREREIATTLQETAQYRQEASRFRETIAPFEHMLRAAGADPFQTVGGLLQTAMALQTAPPGHRAGIVANLIRHYGVDINLLANVLDGQPLPQEAQRGPVQDPRVDQLLAQVEQAKAQRQQALAAEAQRLIAEIQNEEFFPDVKDAMADILEVAAKRGVAMTPREAYNRAVWADPHVAEVLQQRQAHKAAQNPAGSTARSKVAAASIKGSPAGAAVAPQPANLRGDIEAAIDRLRDG